MRQIQRRGGYVKTKAIHIIEDCHGRIHVQKQCRWRSAAYKARRAIRRGKRGGE